MAHPPYYYALVLFCSAIAGGLLFVLTRKQTSKGLKILLSFSAAYLLALSVLHLFPEVYASDIDHVGWYVLAGFMLQVVLDFFSHGVEHGHAHAGHSHGTRFLVTVMASLWIHAFIEGMPFGGVLQHMEHIHEGHSHVHHGHDHRDTLLLGISLHKVTETLVLTSLMFTTGLSKTRIFLLIVLFSLVAPAGAFSHYIIGENGLADLQTLTPKVTAVLIGILLHVSTIILFESEEGHRFNWMKFAAILAGIGTVALFL